MKKDDLNDPLYFEGAMLLDSMSKNKTYSIWMRIIFAICSLVILAENGWLQGFETDGRGIGEEI